MTGDSRRAATKAPRERASAVLHLTSAAGGGVDRYIRDIAANSARAHLIWHVGPRIDVIEHPRGHFLPLSRPGDDAAGTALARWMREAGAGLVHLHGVSAECRSRLALLERTLGLPYVVTLHDVMFVNPGAFEAPGMPTPDPAWIAGLADTLRRAAAVVAPSNFIRDIVVECVPSLPVEIVAPGLRPLPHPPACKVAAEFTRLAPRRIVAVVGAIGPHKGSGILDALAAALTGSDIGIVVIGYTDTQLARGWMMPGRYFVHGPYVDDTLPGWLAAYGADVVLFPNRLPESFSYTLSEVWSAGLPVIVPDEGALGDRVARHGGGWRLAAGYGAPEVARLLERILSKSGAREYGRVKSKVSSSDPSRVPLLDAMVHDLDTLYARYALAPPETAAAEPAPPDALAPLLAANLDGFVFRQELVRLAEELASVNGLLSNSTTWVAKLESDLAEAKAWAGKLELDISDMQAATARLEGDLVASQDWAGKLERDVADMQAATARLEHEFGASQAWGARLEHEFGESQAWAGKLERDVADMQAATVRLDHQLAAAQSWAAKLEGDVTDMQAATAGLELQLADSQSWAAKLEGDVADTLAATDRLELQLADSQKWAAKLEGDVGDMRAATAGLELQLADSQNWAAKLEGDVADTLAATARLEAQFVDSRNWAIKLEGDVTDMQAATAALERHLVESQHWVAKLERDVADTQAAAQGLQRELEESNARSASLERDLAGSRAATATLERNVARLEGVVAESQARTARLEGEVAGLEDTVAGLEKGLGASQAWVGKLEADVATLTAELTRRVEETRRLADDKAAFDLLPEILRKLLLKRVFRARR